MKLAYSVRTHSKATHRNRVAWKGSCYSRCSANYNLHKVKRIDLAETKKPELEKNLGGLIGRFTQHESLWPPIIQQQTCKRRRCQLCSSNYWCRGGCPCVLYATCTDLSDVRSERFTRSNSNLMLLELACRMSRA